MEKTKSEKVFGLAWLPRNEANYQSARQTSGDWSILIERWRIIGRLGWQCVTENIPLEKEVYCPEHGSPESCEDNNCYFCPCQVGAHPQCWWYYDGCCCHSVSDTHGKCPPGGCNHTVKGPESAGWNTSDIETIVRDNWTGLPWYYRLICKISRTKEQVIMQAVNIDTKECRK